MRYLVTGIAGFIGSHVGEALLDAGHEVLGIDCLSDYYDPRLKEANAASFEVAHIDLADDPIDELLGGADGIFHLAAQPGVQSFGEIFPRYVKDNVLASQKLFQSAARNGVRLVFASSSSVYGDAESYPTPETTVPLPRSPYGITKLACEHLARAYSESFGLNAVVLRYFTVYGPRQRPDMSFARIASALANYGEFVVYGDGRQSRSFTYASDAVAATIAAMERAPEGRTYNVGGGSEVTLLEAIECFESVSGRELGIRFMPSAAGDVRRTAADVTRIREELGWKPHVGLKQGLQAQWNWVCRTGRDSAVAH